MKYERTVAVLLALSAALSACGSAQDRPSSSTSSSSTVAAPAAPAELAGYVEVVERVGPSIVTVQSRGGQGSGVVLRPDVVLTNAHVVGEQPDVTIVFADGVSSAANVLAADTTTDLAVMRSERKNLPVPQFRSDLPKPGEPALAMGSPLGFQNSVSAGIISGTHRDIPGSAAATSSLVDLIQTDASISPGNSGGALLDAQGRVVGINEAYIPPAAGAVSLGFAIPSATALDVANQLLADGTATHPYLGVSVGQLTPAIRREFGVQVDHGALVVGVDRDAPVAVSGLRPGDVIVEFAGKPVNTVEDLLSSLRQTQPGTQTSLVFMRGTQRQQVTVTVGSRDG
jgi:serine protease Do